MGRNRDNQLLVHRLGLVLNYQLNARGAVLHAHALQLLIRHGANLELFEYSSPDQNTQVPKNSDIGGHHLAFYVDDFDQALAYLISNGIEVMGEPVVRTAGPSGGQTWVYFKAPWGLQLELVSFPKGKLYEQDYDQKLWHPAYPDQ